MAGRGIRNAGIDEALRVQVLTLVRGRLLVTGIQGLLILLVVRCAYLQLVRGEELSGPGLLWPSMLWE